MLSRASSLVYGRLSLAAADLAKRGDQIIEGVRVLHEQHLAAILGQPAPAIEAGDRRFDSSRKPPLVFKREPNVDDPVDTWLKVVARHGMGHPSPSLICRKFENYNRNDDADGSPLKGSEASKFLHLFIPMLGMLFWMVQIA
jgi:hypothetical protein